MPDADEEPELSADDVLEVRTPSNAAESAVATMQQTSMTTQVLIAVLFRAKDRLGRGHGFDSRSRRPPPR